MDISVESNQIKLMIQYFSSNESIYSIIRFVNHAKKNKHMRNTHGKLAFLYPKSNLTFRGCY